jgi:hypothetical protein
MMGLFKLFRHVLASLFKSRAKLEAQNLILRQQVNVLRRQAPKRTHFHNTDWLLFCLTLSLVPFPPWHDCNCQPGDDRSLRIRFLTGTR